MITLENVTKYYPTPLGKHYVLRNVSLVVPLGKNIGVIGRNGAGKSTLLRLMAGVDYPNQGRIQRIGRYSWPLALAGRGIQGTMTGKENVIFAGRIHGMHRAEIGDLVRRVAEFSELGEFFEMPVSTYSSGMRARLSFSIAMLFDFDCYFIDELNAVGDRRFRRLTHQYFEDKRKKATFVQVSHDLDDLHRTCESGLLVDDGNVTYYEEVDQAIEAYNRLMEVSGESEPDKPSADSVPATDADAVPVNASRRSLRTRAAQTARRKPKRIKKSRLKASRKRGQKLGLSPASQLALRSKSVSRKRRRKRNKDTATS